jgi:hypothetical protein
LTLNKFKNNTKGSITVEAAIVFPIICLAIFAVIYICMLLYQRAYIQAIADMAVKRAAVTWDNSRKDIVNGFVKKTEMGESGLLGLYSDLIGINTKSKEGNLKRYINAKINTYDVLKSWKGIVDVKYDNYIIYKKLNVIITQKYEIPLGEMLTIFGLDKYYTIQVKSNAVINDPKTVIDNVDFILEVAEEYGLTDNAFVSKWQENMGSMGDKINEFFK